jgi:Thiamine pyrophosphate enzyme, C-terminal TPP binding domain
MPAPTHSTSSKSPANPRTSAASYDNAKVISRFDLTKRLVAKLEKDEAVIGGIGNTNFDLWSAGRRPQNFYMLGSMGLAIPIALGVALAQPQRHVIALEGDGSLLMQLGCLTTIAALKPANLTIVIMDNGLYQITGGQATPAAGIADYVALARAPASPSPPGPPTRRISTAWSTWPSPRAARPSSPPASTTSPASAPPTATPCKSANASCTGSGCGGCRRGQSLIESRSPGGALAKPGTALPIVTAVPDFAGAPSGLRLRRGIG